MPQNNLHLVTHLCYGSDGVAHHAELWAIWEILEKQKGLE